MNIDILTKNGFEYVNKNVVNRLRNCYEKLIDISNTFRVWVAVEPKTSKVCMYVEYECGGGEVASYDFKLSVSFLENPEKAYSELAEKIENLIETYNW